MKFFITSLFSLAAILSSFSVVALQRDTPQEPASLYEHMNEINSEWTHINPKDYSETISFRNEDERIHTHLLKVIDYLNVNEPDVFSVNQLNRRRHLLSQLSSYADAQVFPMNIYHAQRTPYFIDHRGVHCAVGYLILQSGEGALAQAISSAHNYDYIKDITTEGFSEWAKNHGFTIDELKWIQPGYSPAQQMAPVGQGTNGPVTVMKRYGYSKLVMAGDFTLLDGMDCLNIGMYEEDQFSCLGSGIEGVIQDLVVTETKVYASGEFYSKGELFPLAIFENDSWQYVSIPEVSNARGYGLSGQFFDLSGVDFENYRCELVIEDLNAPGQHKVYRWNFNGAWEHRFTVDGKINAMSQIGSSVRLYAGQFSTVYHDGQQYEADNAFINNFYQDTGAFIEPLLGETSSEILAVETVGSSFYLAGKCGSEGGEPEVCISRYLNGSMQAVLLNSFEAEFEVQSIYFDNDASLFMGGAFNYNGGVIYGNNLARLNLVSYGAEPLGILNGAVNTILKFSDYYYIGGDFTENLGAELNHLAKISDGTNSISENSIHPIKTYPNPATDLITVELEKKAEATLELVSVTGQIVLSRNVTSAQAQSSQLDVAEIARGLYYLRVSQAGVVTISKVVLE